MSFEKFEGGGRGRSSAGPMISLRKSGSIGINGAAMEAYFEDVDGVVLYFDGTDDRVGLEPVDDASQEGAYTISRTNGTGTVVPSAFLSTYDLVPEVTTQFEPEVVEADDGTDLVSVDLDDPIGTYGSPDDGADETDDDGGAEAEDE